MRQLCQHVAGSYGSLELIGTAASIADQMQTWLQSENLGLRRPRNRFFEG